jgi:hypothetical protein
VQATGLEGTATRTINRDFLLSFLRHFNNAKALQWRGPIPSPRGDLQSRLFGRRDNGLVHHHADIV